MNYKQMSAKKLNTMLEKTTDEETRNAIQAELDARAELANELKDENASKAEQPKAEAPKAKKLDETELHNLAETLRATNMHKRCEVVPFNTVEWVPGYIAAVVVDKKNGKIMYNIKTDDGRKVVKVHDSKLLKISEEKVTVVRAVRGKSATPKEALTPEALAELKAKYQGNIGAAVEFVDKENVTITGRIIGFMFDARVNTLFYKIQVVEGDATRIVHKVIDSEAIKVMLPLDEEGEAINAKYIERSSRERKVLTKEEKIAQIQAKIDKIKAQKAELEARLAELEAAENAAGIPAETVEETTEDEDLA